MQIIVPRQYEDRKGQPYRTNQGLQILSAELRIGKELNTVQIHMKEWFYTCAFIGILCIMIFQGTLLFCFQLCWTSFNTEYEEESKISEGNYRRHRNRPQQRNQANDENYDEKLRNNEDASEMFMNLNLNFDENNSNKWEDMSSSSDDDKSSIDSLILDDMKKKLQENEGKNYGKSEQSRNSIADSSGSIELKSIKNKRVIPMKRKSSPEEEEKNRAEKIMKGSIRKFDSETGNAIISGDER